MSIYQPRNEAESASLAHRTVKPDPTLQGYGVFPGSLSRIEPKTKVISYADFGEGMGIQISNESADVINSRLFGVSWSYQSLEVPENATIPEMKELARKEILEIKKHEARVNNTTKHTDNLWLALRGEAIPKRTTTSIVDEILADVEARRKIVGELRAELGL